MSSGAADERQKRDELVGRALGPFWLIQQKICSEKGWFACRSSLLCHGSVPAAAWKISFWSVHFVASAVARLSGMLMLPSMAARSAARTRSGGHLGLQGAHGRGVRGHSGGVGAFSGV